MSNGCVSPTARQIRCEKGVSRSSDGSIRQQFIRIRIRISLLR